jgi:hypothetical protein
VESRGSAPLLDSVPSASAWRVPWPPQRHSGYGLQPLDQLLHEMNLCCVLITGVELQVTN